ncbi:OprO/OprP family phosphate-selective porin [Belliella sp. DSM 107340]|uniref:OprO/OprP family phosphate-selective porin n=1 Tax=Belliella calami TaxID=2923436 RepID=A0ABS9UKI5_9BACT|nr:porin [Belliella calami]MCH7397092.1 OprO/OprP family phosphate-selective porin [Belliella calami]
MKICDLKRIAAVFIILFLIGVNDIHCQTVESDERALLNVDEGIRFSKDSLFQMNLRFRMQNRAGFNSIYDGENLGVEQFEMRVRRLRLRFDGYVLSPKFQYYIQLAFSKADLDLETGDIAQPVRDAILYYTINKNLYLGFGQSKLPGNRERVISSGNLQFADRSIANSLFTLDRDFGLFGYYTLRTRSQSIFLLKGAISSGDGRNASAVNNGLSYTGRIEALPFGVFRNSGDYSEGDLEFEPLPKLSVGITLSENQKAIRTGGQLGAELFQARTLNSLIVDAMFKYQGWALMSEYMSRSTKDPITTNEVGDVRFVIVGKGVNTHVSRMIGPKSELALRYAFVVPDKSIDMYLERVDESLIGFTHYLNGHRIKIQANLGYRWLEGLYQIENSGNSWTGMFQVEFGI